VKRNYEDNFFSGNVKDKTIPTITTKDQTRLFAEGTYETNDNNKNNNILYEVIQIKTGSNGRISWIW
jgi:hypothetical protein